MIDHHTLYVDNFRGFKSTFVPVADINFLVGENSSGKTSILSLLKLMSDDQLLLVNRFAADDVDLGTFKDIVSAHSDDAGYFRIGMVRREVNNAGSMPLAMLVTYEKHEGLPQDLCFTCTYGEKEISLRRVGKECHFRTLEGAITPDTDGKRLIERWVEEHDRPRPDLKRLDIALHPEESLLLPLSLIAQNVHPKAGTVRILPPAVFPQLTWVAPIRTKPRRTYDQLQRGFSSEGTHTPYLIRKILDTESQARRFKAAIQRVGKESGLFQSVNIQRFGADVTSPFEIQVVLDEKPFNLTNVGYGVSQALPVLVEILWRKKGTWFAIQQPEVHLHPRAQAALGDLIYSTADSEEKRFLIETHSDFMIDRYRRRVRGGRPAKHSSQLLFFERRNKRNTVTCLKIDHRGELPARQPRGYRGFFIKEQMELLKV